MVCAFTPIVCAHVAVSSIVGSDDIIPLTTKAVMLQKAAVDATVGGLHVGSFGAGTELVGAAGIVGRQWVGWQMWASPMRES